MYTKDDYIAVFDSGVGGISVLRQLRKQMPAERYIYFGDTANAPYGSRTTQEVRELTLAAAEKLRAEYPIKALVVACNTATAAAIETLREAYPDLIVIGIEPALKLAADHFPGGHIGVMATQVTLREKKFDHLLHCFSRGCTVSKIPAPGLVELIESGRGDSADCEAFMRGLLEPYAGKLDALVLGCTHYPFVQRTIAKVLGPGTLLLHGGQGTARETRRRLEKAGLLREGRGETIIRESQGNPDKIALAWRLLQGGTMKYESLIFDIDGTLWDSRALVAEGYNIQLRAEGLDHLCTDAEALRPLFGKVMTEIGDALFASIPVPERYELMDRCMATENQYLFENECKIGYPKVRETMEELAKNHRLFIVSNSQCGYPELCMEKLGIAHLISGHLCFGDTGTCKGETIKRLMQQHGVLSACYIGDTQGDYEAAVVAGIPFVWCTYGFGTPDGYALKADSFEQLKEVL